MEGSSSSSISKSDGELEEMLDRMLTRLALCDDSKLEALVSNLLPLTISSLSSQSPTVRNKVLEILSHVNKRVKHQREIGLPLLSLWKLYTDPAASPMVRNFAIVYVEMAFERAPAKEREEIAPTTLENLSKLPQQHQEILLRIAIKVIGECHEKQISDDVSAKYKSLIASQDRELFLDFCLHMVLYQPSSQGGGSSPGLSVFQVNRIMGKQALKGNMLTKRKLGILNVIGTMDLPGESVYPLYIAASVDSQEPVAKKGEDLLKKKASGTNLDDPKLINRLFLLFNGTTATEHVAPEHNVVPGNTALKMKLMSAFCRSIAAAKSFPATLQCIFGCMFGIGTTLRLKQMGMEFTVWVFKHGKIDQLKLMGPVILNAILKMLDGFTRSEADALSRETKTFSFQAIGLIAQRLPHLFREKTEMAVRLFDALKLETQALRSTIQEAVISLASAYKPHHVRLVTCHSSLGLPGEYSQGFGGASASKFSGGTTATEHVAPEHNVVPGNTALKMKLMSAFCRSIAAAKSFPATLQCIFGCMFGIGTTLRLKQMGMEFTVWVFKHGKIDQLKLMGPVILNAILKMLDGFTRSEADALSRETKTFSFQAIGLIAQRLPHLFREKTEMAVRLFDALKLETQALRSTIQEAVISLASAYKDSPENILRDLEVLLLANSLAEQNEARFCALRWATSLYHSQHCPSLYICMLSAADPKLDIRELALEGLFLKEEARSIVSNHDHKYPKFVEMLEYILKQQPKLLESTEMRSQKLLFPSQVYLVMIKFLVKCFELEMEDSNTQAVGTEFLNSAQRMCLLLEHSLAFEGSAELHACASKALVSVGSYLPEMVEVYCSQKIVWLRRLLSHTDLSTRESASRLLGMGSCALSDIESCSLLSELISSVSQPQKLRFEEQHGGLCAVGFVSAHCLYRMPTVSEAVTQNAVKCLVDVVNLETALLASVAMEALGHIGICGALPLLVSNSSPGTQVLEVLQDRLSKLLSGDDIKSVQKIALSLGHICSNEMSSLHRKIALDLLFSLSRSKAEEVLFAAGEALSFLWGGVPVTADMILKTNFSSLSTDSNFLMRELRTLSKNMSDAKTDANEDSRVATREIITGKLFDSLLYSIRKDERCAGTVWMLSLTMYCGQQPSIQLLLPKIQEAFSHLLGDQNELTQELASQGMSIVYDLGDASMKQNLVDALVNTLTGTCKRKRAIKLVEESEVFQEGTIGESPSGGKISTYKELCNLANEMGQPDLIYKFMDLANHQASLNSKRGAAFGFSKIAKQAGDALQPHLRLLIPRLIRYQYDPDKNVQDAMAHIWKALIQDPKKAVDEHLNHIFDDLLVQCGSRLWRSREASSLALADIIQGRKFDQVGEHLKRIWIASFRAMDDIKETVRNAGDKLCRAVTSLTIRICDVTLTKLSDARQAMDIVLPLLLSEGIMSKVSSVRKASIGVVMKLAKGAGIALRPHLSDLVCCMLESLSSLEDQGLNYVELHAANIGIETEKLENLRISISKGSPMWETLDLCINIVDIESLDQLIPRLTQLVRGSVGLNTRVGVASFFSLLIQKVGSEIKPFTGMLLRLLFPVAKEEKSSAAKRAFSSACGIVLKYSSPSQAQSLIEETAALHSGDRSSQIACASLLKSFSSTASDIMSGHQSAIVPAVFISRFEDDKQISSLFEEVWEDITSCERVTLQLFLQEIVNHICESITSSSWASKKKSGRAICKLSEVLGESLSPHHKRLLQCLVNEIPGRLWEGKDALLDALGALSVSCHEAITKEDPTAPTTILSLICSACKKKAKKYRESAFSCLEKVIIAFGDPEFFNTVFPMLYEMCNTASVRTSCQVPLASNAVKTESENGEDGQVPLEKIMECVSSCIQVATIDDILRRKADLIHVLLISLSPGFLWNVKMSGISCVGKLCSRFRSLWNDSMDGLLPSDATKFAHELYHSVVPKLLECINTVKIAQVHVAASQCLLELIELHSMVSSLHPVEVDFKAEIISLLEVEKSEEAKSLLRKSRDALPNLPSLS